MKTHDDMSKRVRWSPRRVLALLAAVIVGVSLTVLVTLVTTGGSPCGGVSFHAPESSFVPPPIGGRAPILDQIRRAFRLTHTNVVYCHDFADPSVLRVGDSYYAYSTNNGDRHIPVLYGTGIFDTQHVADALPTLPRWAASDTVWAPAVMASADRYVMYYTTKDRATDALCISVAFARQPQGPFVDISAAPIVCDALDPHPFIDRDHTPYLLWTGDGTIRSARLNVDLQTRAGPAVDLIAADQPWEDGIVEAPTMLLHGTTYLLFFSANHWNSPAYAIGYARCATVSGPCQPGTRPWIKSQGHVHGPGGEDVFTDTDGHLWMVFHAWITNVGYPHGARSLFALPIAIKNNAPVISNAP